MDNRKTKYQKNKQPRNQLQKIKNMEMQPHLKVSSASDCIESYVRLRQSARIRISCLLRTGRILSSRTGATWSAILNPCRRPIMSNLRRDFK